jgi:D-3-phosphoglycerate dehydrogenase
MPRVLITDFMGEDTALEESLFAQAGVDVNVASSAEVASWRDLAVSADAILTRHAPIHAVTIDSLRSCKVIARYGTGYDNIDVARAVARNIIVTNVPGFSTEEVADHTAALLLAAARHVLKYATTIRGGAWMPEPLPPVRRLRGQRLAILGFGRIGQAVAERMLPFGVRIVAYDPMTTRAMPGVEKASSLDELVTGADFLCLHAPLTTETARCIDARRLAMLNPGAIVVNVARGGVLDLEAAMSACEARQVGALALDVVDEEPLPQAHPLRLLEHAIVTPHVAYYSRASVEEAKRRSVGEILAVLDGGEPSNPVTPAAAPREDTQLGQLVR